MPCASPLDCCFSGTSQTNLLRHLGHLRTAVRTAPAFRRALLHHVAAAHLLARRCARSANFGTRCARRAVMLRVSSHEIGARGADLRAIQQKRDVGRARMLTSLVETVSGRMQACLMTRCTGVYAGLHPIAVSVSRRVRHVPILTASLVNRRVVFERWRSAVAERQRALLRRQE